MVRSATWIGWIIPLLLLAGCSSTGNQSWLWSQATAQQNELIVPPENDPRFSQPPSYPKNSITPALKQDTFDSRRGLPLGSGPSRPVPGGSMIR